MHVFCLCVFSFISICAIVGSYKLSIIILLHIRYLCRLFIVEFLSKLLKKEVIGDIPLSNCSMVISSVAFVV